MKTLLDSEVLYYCSGISKCNNIDLLGLKKFILNNFTCISIYTLYEIIISPEKKDEEKQKVLNYINDNKIKILNWAKIINSEKWTLDKANILCNDIKEHILNKITDAAIKFIMLYINITPYIYIERIIILKLSGYDKFIITLNKLQKMLEKKIKKFFISELKKVNDNSYAKIYTNLIITILSNLTVYLNAIYSFKNINKLAYEFETNYKKYKNLILNIDLGNKKVDMQKYRELNNINKLVEFIRSCGGAKSKNNVFKDFEDVIFTFIRPGESDLSTKWFINLASKYLKNNNITIKYNDLFDFYIFQTIEQDIIKNFISFDGAIITNLKQCIMLDNKKLADKCRESLSLIESFKTKNN